MSSTCFSPTAMSSACGSNAILLNMTYNNIQPSPIFKTTDSYYTFPSSSVFSPNCTPFNYNSLKSQTISSIAPQLSYIGEYQIDSSSFTSSNGVICNNDISTTINSSYIPPNMVMFILNSDQKSSILIAIIGRSSYINITPKKQLTDTNYKNLISDSSIYNNFNQNNLNLIANNNGSIDWGNTGIKSLISESDSSTLYIKLFYKAFTINGDTSTIIPINWNYYTALCCGGRIGNTMTCVSSACDSMGNTTACDNAVVDYCTTPLGATDPLCACISNLSSGSVNLCSGSCAQSVTGPYLPGIVKCNKCSTVINECNLGVTNSAGGNITIGTLTLDCNQIGDGSDNTNDSNKDTVSIFGIDIPTQDISIGLGLFILFIIVILASYLVLKAYNHYNKSEIDKLLE